MLLLVYFTVYNSHILYRKEWNFAKYFIWLVDYTVEDFSKSGQNVYYRLSTLKLSMIKKRQCQSVCLSQFSLFPKIEMSVRMLVTKKELVILCDGVSDEEVTMNHSKEVQCYGQMR